jgi:flagellar M-ring protein FliF
MDTGTVAETVTFKAQPSETAKMIDIAQIQGQVHAQSVEKVGEIADRNPHETVSIIRQWLHDSAAA